MWDHPVGCNKIQDHFKDQEFVVVEQLCKSNMYCIRPVSGDGPEWVVNYRQLHDLQKANNESDKTGEEEMGGIPCFNLRTQLKETPYHHKYASQARGWPTTLVQSIIACMGKDSSDGLE